ncbi:S8 family serine peptidase [Actinomadura fulvescens]|uniref:S8 family serine peptidase n=1 Tax=Actinomadura fulvescens TaxID=46160 RepID=A0ABN3Q337_9ACTN
MRPFDVQPLIAAGRLDPRLFEVDRLLAEGHDDARRDRLPLIARRPGGALRAQARSARTIAGTGLTALQADKSRLPELWRDFVADPDARLWLDAQIKVATDGSVPRIGAPVAWQRGLTGKGVKVAVLDSGVDRAHPDLSSAVTESRDFTSSGSADDKVGHGTHVASILAGSGAASGGKYRGVAPDAEIVSGKVVDDAGQGQESWVLGGMAWAAREARAKVVNLSVYCFCDSTAVDPVEQAVEELSAETGTLFVAAVGDYWFPAPGLVGLPAAAGSALAVSSVDREDRPWVTAQGPRPQDYSVKPEVLAPGEGIVAARAKNTRAGSPVDDHYTRLSGTSAATPHVAGAAAILAQRHPDWTGERLKAALMAAAKNLPGVDTYTQGSGRVDVAKAVSQELTTSPASVHATVRWSDAGEAPVVTRKITYTNDGDAPLGLTLGVALVAQQGGAPLPAESATLDRERITVPAGGRETVTLTLRGLSATGGIKAGAFSGYLTATAADGTPALRTPVGAYVEPPTTSLRLPITDRDGDPGNAGNSFVTIVNVQTGDYVYPQPDDDGVVSARVPAGTYLISGAVDTKDTWTTGFTQVYDLAPGTREIPLDARRTAPVELTNDQPDAVLTGAAAQLIWQRGTAGSSLHLRGDARRRISVQPAAGPGLGYDVSTLWEREGSGPEQPSPYVFRDYRYADGAIPSDPGLRTRRAELARILTDVRSQGAATRGWFRWSASHPGSGLFGGEAMGVTRPVPGSFTLYLRAGRDVAWHTSLWQFENDPLDGGIRISRGPRSYRAGPQADLINAAVLGPVPDGGSTRTGDALRAETGCPFTGALDGCGMDGTLGGTLRLSRGGTVIAERRVPQGWNWYWLDATLAPEAATYTLQQSLTRDDPLATLSAKVDSTWTFTSSRTAPGEKRVLPLLSVAYLPTGLNGHNAAPKDRATIVPVWVRRSAGAPGAVPKTLTVEASFDDGATWRPLRLTGSAVFGSVTIRPPAGAEYVSLRATATDSAGNGVVQTVTRAYRLG